MKRLFTIHYKPGAPGFSSSPWWHGAGWILVGGFLLVFLLLAVAA